MTNQLTTWILGGALAASLAWNARDTFTRSRADPACGPAACDPSGCAEALSALDLTPDQRMPLAEWSANACRESARLDAVADAKSAELFALLASPAIEPERARTLATEAGALRTQSLAACVESLLTVRRHLSPEQVDKLLSTCCAPTNR